MNKEELRQNIADKIRSIRVRHRNEKGKRMNQAEFTALLNKTEPLDITFEIITFGSYERGDRVCPADKYEKILSLGDGFKV